MRRQGYLLCSIHAVCMEDLIRRGQEADAEEYNDKVKPLVDLLLQFEFEGERGAP